MSHRTCSYRYGRLTSVRPFQVAVAEHRTMRSKTTRNNGALGVNCRGTSLLAGFPLAPWSSPHERVGSSRMIRGLPLHGTKQLLCQPSNTARRTLQPIEFKVFSSSLRHTQERSLMTVGEEKVFHICGQTFTPAAPRRCDQRTRAPSAVQSLSGVIHQRPSKRSQRSSRIRAVRLGRKGRSSLPTKRTWTRATFGVSKI